MEDLNLNFEVESKSKVRTMLYLEKIKKQTIIQSKIENENNSEQIDVYSLPNIRIKNMATN